MLDPKRRRDFALYAYALARKGRGRSAGGGSASAPPVNATAPEISGAPTVGETLSASNGTWVPAAVSYVYQWYADDVAISGATSSTYTLQAAEEAAVITVGVIAVNSDGPSDEAVSDPTSAIASSDSTAPVLTSPTGVQTGPTAATVGATTDEANGLIWWVVTTSSTAPTSAQIQAGTDHLDAAAAADGFITVSSTGAKTGPATGLTASTAYYAHLIHIDQANNESNIVSSAQFTTAAAPDVTAPTLTSPTDAANGSTRGTLSVSTDEANGTLYGYVSTSATPPSAADLKAGTGAVWADSQGVTTTGVQAMSADGLTASTAYYSYFLHRDSSGNDSSISSADGFTTSAVIAPVLTQTSSAGGNPLSWSGYYEDAVIGTDFIGMRYRINAGSWIEETEVLFDSDFYLTYHVDGTNYPWPLFAADTFVGGDEVDVEEYILRDAARTYSTTLTDTMAATDVTYTGSTYQSDTSSTSISASTLAFSAGRAIVALTCYSTSGATNSVPASLTLTPSGGGSPITLSALGDDGVSAGRRLALYASAGDISAGNYDLTGTRPNAARTGMTYGVVVGADTTLASGPTFTTALNEINPHETASMTYVANGLILGWLHNIGAVDGTVNSPSVLVANVRADAGHGIVMGSRDSTGTISFNTLQANNTDCAIVFAPA